MDKIFVIWLIIISSFCISSCKKKRSGPDYFISIVNSDGKGGGLKFTKDVKLKSAGLKLETDIIRESDGFRIIIHRYGEKSVYYVEGEGDYDTKYDDILIKIREII